MARRRRRGYYASGEFIAEGSERDAELRAADSPAEAPSRSQQKRESAELQVLGEQLLELRGPAFDGLRLPERLADALLEARRITDFEGRRRQLQYIGRLMRTLEPDDVQAIRSALDAEGERSRRETAALHRAETWRQRLIASDDALSDWMAEFPETDVQRLRALLRQTRKEWAANGQRHGKSYRDIFHVIREQFDRTARA